MVLTTGSKFKIELSIYDKKGYFTPKKTKPIVR